MLDSATAGSATPSASTPDTAPGTEPTLAAVERLVPATLLGFIADRMASGVARSMCINVPDRDSVDAEYMALRSLPGADTYCHAPYDADNGDGGLCWRQALVYFKEPCRFGVTISSPHVPNLAAEEVGQ